MYCGSWKIDDLLTFTAITTRFDTGAATDADSAPTYRVYEDETGTAILTGSMALLDSANTAGFYSEQITLSAANGFEKGKSYNIYIQATVNSVTGATIRNFQMEAEVDANIVSDKTGYILSSAGIQAIWDALTSALTTANSIGKLLVDNINATISSRLASASYTTPPTVGAISDGVWDESLAGHGVVGTAGNALNSASSYAILVHGIVDGMWVAKGTIGATGNDATHIHLPGLTQGNDELNNMLLVIYDNSTGETHSRWILDYVAATGLATVDTLPFAPEASIDYYYIFVDRSDGLTAVDIRSAVGLASANLDTQLDALPTAAENATAVLSAALSNPIDANVQEINDVLLTGNGSTTPWGPV